MTFEEVVRDHVTLTTLSLSPDGRRVLLGLEGGDPPSGGVPDRLSATRAEIHHLDGHPPDHVGDRGAPFAPHPCTPWSPGGDYVAGMTLVGGERRLAVWDVKARRTIVFPAAPAAQCAWWIGERLVYPLGPPGGATAGSSSELGALRQLARWRAAWSGQAQVTVHSANPAVAASPDAPGGIGLADPRTGEATVIAVGDVPALAPSPDGQWLAAAQLGAPDPDALARPAGRLARLRLIRMTGTPEVSAPVLSELDLDPQALAWSPGSRQLLAGGRDRATGELGLWVVDVAAGSARRIRLPAGVRLGAGPRGAYGTLRQIGWLGGSPAFIAATEAPAGAPGAVAQPSTQRADYGEGQGLRFDLYAERQGVVTALSDVSGQSVTAFAATPSGCALFVADGALWGRYPTGRPRRITPRRLKVVRLLEARPSLGLPPVFAPTDRRVAVSVASEAGPARPVVLDTASGAIRLHLDEAGQTSLSGALDRAVVAAARGWATEIRLAGDQSGHLTTLNPAGRRRPTAVLKRLRYRALGRELTGWVLLPPGYGTGPRAAGANSTPRLPTVVWIYGGRTLDGGPPRDAEPGRAATPVFSGQLWAARGYAVLYPSTPLRPASEADAPALLAEATVAAVDAAAAAGWTDPERVGLIGHSFGGYSTAAVLARRSDRFRAGIAISGPYDFVGGWGLRGPREAFEDRGDYGFGSETRGKVEQGQIGLGAPPFAAPEAYVRASTLFAAPTIRTPLLLAVGDLDPGSTALTQSERFFAALARAGNPAVLVRYWGQGHVQDDPWAVRDQWRRFNAWFDLYLKTAPSGPDPEPGSASAAPTPR
ncbi:MAG: hypothetical protein DI570_08865 [Phenylobacterium zucineum]|nr:MAG: hypothetical protein DI570_08865 [Phenylobacterium zucineum]